MGYTVPCRYIVPCRYFDAYNTQSFTFVYENRTLILVINAIYGYVQYLFLVQEHSRHLSTLQPMPYMAHRPRLHPVTEILPCPYTLPQWEGLMCIEDPRALVSILHLGVLSGLEYLWETRVENDDEKNKSKITQLYSLLPNTQLLNYLCLTLGRNSFLIQELCKEISLELKKRSSTIVDVWAAYMPGKENEITFMVITKKNCESPIIRDRPFVHRCIDDFSTEAAYVIENEIPLRNDLRKNLRSVVNRHTGSLLQQHKNITSISVSSVKSRNFNTMKELCPVPCIVIYVHVKGMIPIDEEALPTRLDGFDVDVREGAFSPFLHEPNQVPDSISMGCQIQGPGENVDEDGNVLGGTLGGFIDHPEFGLCCITSAHVILSAETMRTINPFGWQPPHTYNNICYQPCPPHGFGRVVLAVCKEGNDDSSGVEVVMITVEDRPLADKGSDGLPYRSGDIMELSELIQQMDNSYMEVIKYGAETGITKGKVHSEQTTIKFISPELSHSKLNFTLRNQIEIIGDDIFAKPGDSGAIVFHVAQNKPLKAIGMLEGGTSYNTFIVTPICEILKSLDLPPPLHMKVFDHVHMGTDLDYLEQRVENLEGTTENIKADVADIKTELQQQRQTMDEQGQKLDQIIGLLTARK
ncbi:uncharacterized protein LOC123542924 [Mercenaria mercenaria]|uniref:uncharacterized protein LOC123542924 n=1 Tax=Mercenaria mercenaria TaxID=6596 RepID=UPI00234F6E22|nr:uncharacterized protein LOC123542924 [Mercenaria mercenaria]XP_053386954.1 uncharacterized protein LOC123542924 [Mercenaria mercenaria]XP_053386955.1 uncharacterized protein LOC123542924 [Mercenaria mercenaria]XP_053386956.1 uncharacterized protein LOC123542924 [Mercenaria mercenaria]